MMTKKRTGSKASLKMIMAIPLAFMLIVLFACNNNKSTPAGTKAAPDQTATEQAAPEGATSEMPDDVYKVVDQMPVFSNDTSAHALFKWLTENIEYPEVAKKNGIQGKVVVRFVIDENGNVINPEVIQNVDPALDKAALDVISKCPQWEPGKQKGKPVKVSMAIPITFALN